MLKKIALIILPALLTGCANLSSGGATVALVDTAHQLPNNCSKVGFVEGYGPQEDLASAFEVAKIHVRNQAASRNANYVVITKQKEMILPIPQGAIVGGDAYDCVV